VNNHHLSAALARERVAHLIGEARAAGRRIEDPRTAAPKGGPR
jgi:hypothetical protein